MSAAYMPWIDPPKPKAHAARTCDQCRHFEPDAINPPAGVGVCHGVLKGGTVYPGVDRHCSEWAKR